MTFRDQLFALFDDYESADFSTAELAARFKCSVATALRYRNEWLGIGSDAVAEIHEFPLMTWAGIMWTSPVKPPSVWRGENVDVCDKCALLDICEVTDLHWDFVGCERALESELI